MTEISLQQQFADNMGQLLGPDFPTDIALAVSGGGDSMAMLYLAHNWTRDWGVRLHVVTVDHGLRPESADEAAMVARECAVLGWSHATLKWDWDGQGNKMDAARRARIALIDAWRGKINHVLLAHTEDDLAEGFLMRLKRGAGLDGLAAMEPKRTVFRQQLDEGQFPMILVRPCLGMARADLRHYLKTLQGVWVDDPSNDDPAFDRARMRAILSLLDKEGIDRTTLAQTATRLRADTETVRQRAAQIWQDVGQSLPGQQGAETGVLMLKPDWHRFVEPATQRRILSGMLRYISSADYAPRAESLESFRDRLLSGGTGPLHGCDVRFLKGWTVVFRELAATQGSVEVRDSATLWDGRWVVDGAAFAGLTIRALGEDGWRQVENRSDPALPHRMALSLPSLWEGETLVACDALGVGPGQTTRLSPKGIRQPYFPSFLLSH